MRYWIGVASKDHVARGVSGGFCQLCHGKGQPLKRMGRGDWIIYYSSKEIFGCDEPCQQFTAIGRVQGDEIYQIEMAPDFIPFRRNINFLPAQPLDIRPLINQLNFIQNKSRWGYAFRFGHIEISQHDFELISSKMLAPEMLLSQASTAAYTKPKMAMFT
jgi:hypothetical protein